MVPLLFLSLLLIVWWVGVWGLLESAVTWYSRGNLAKQIIAYGTLVGVVLGYLVLNPHVLERFV
jgi:hypothetical protein